MIVTLTQMIREIKETLDDWDGWDSLIIDRRKPHTRRAFRQFGDIRVCLHAFEPCESTECFAHPHPWPGAFLMLKGEYVHKIGYSVDLESEPTFLYKEIVRPYTTYEIIDRQTWHSVQPLKRSFTVMINGEPWENQHKETRTTKGKDLKKMNSDELGNHLHTFTMMLNEYEFWIQGRGANYRG